MAETLSPGVYIDEIDASTIVSGSSNSIAGFSGKFNKGAINTFVQIDNVQRLIDNYGYPDDMNYNEWFQCYNFLSYGKNLLVSRAANIDGSLNKQDGVTVITNNVIEIIEPEIEAKKASCEIAIAKEAGTKYNDVKIEVTAGTPETIQEGVKAQCKYGTALEAGTKQNSWKIVITGETGNWNISINDGVSDVYNKTNYEKDTILNTDLTNPFITFNNVELSAETVFLTGGKDLITAETYNVKTLFDDEEVDNQENVRSISNLVNNDYVDFLSDSTLNISTYELTGGVDYQAPVTKEHEDMVELSSISQFAVNDIVQFGDYEEWFIIKNVDYDLKTIQLDRTIKANEHIRPNDEVYKVNSDYNASNEAVSENLVLEHEITYNEQTYMVQIPQDVGSRYDLFYTNKQILNYADFDEKQKSISFYNPTNSKIKIISKNPGRWADDIKICIAKPESFEANDLSLEHVPHYAFEGVKVDDLFEYAPKGSEVGFIVYDNRTKTILEVYTVDFDKTARDSNNKSTYIEKVINNNSLYVYVKENEACKAPIADYTMVYDEKTNQYIGKPLTLYNASNSDIQANDLMNGYEVFSNKEELDIDIIIANERDNGASAKNLVDIRKDCIAFIGCNYEDVVNKRGDIATSNLVNWRKFTINYNNMFCVACGNYKYQYDRYNDVNRWINIAGDIAGLRAYTNSSKASWWASAGLERGQIQNVIKLAFNPTQTQRDTLYKNAINPIVTFPGQGSVMWGQKTMLDKPSSFDRVNIRGLFNYIERSLSKMAKYQVMEFNDNYTRNKIISMIKPFLTEVKAGRGIQDFMVICDESNNTPQIIAQNQLVVDVLIKPTYVAEYVCLKFTNAGVNSFSEIYTA